MIGAAFAARSVRDALFLAHVGADRLPIMYILTPVVGALAAPLYAAIEQRVPRRFLIFSASSGLELAGYSDAPVGGVAFARGGWLIAAGPQAAPAVVPLSADVPAEMLEKALRCYVPWRIDEGAIVASAGGAGP